MLRFTIRDVLWLTVVVALTVGWYVNRSSLIRANDAQLREVSAKESLAKAEAGELRHLVDALIREGGLADITINTRFYRRNPTDF